MRGRKIWLSCDITKYRFANSFRERICLQQWVLYWIDMFVDNLKRMKNELWKWKTSMWTIYILHSDFSWPNYLLDERNTIITQRQKMQQRIDTNHNERKVRWRRMMEVNHIDMIVHPHMIVYERFNGLVKVTWHIETHLYG